MKLKKPCINIYIIKIMRNDQTTKVKIAQALRVSVEYLVTGEELTPSRLSHGPEIRDLIQNFKLLSEDDRKIVIAIIQLLRNRGIRHKESTELP